MIFFSPDEGYVCCNFFKLTFHFALTRLNPALIIYKLLAQVFFARTSIFIHIALGTSLISP